MVESFGSSKAPQDLEKGNVDIGAMSEPMSSKDRQNFKNIYGYEPLEIKVANDMIAVLVNIENPINCMTTDELDGVYSNTFLCQGSTNITTWGDLNLVGEWANTTIKVYGRTPASGTYDIFRKIALCNGTYKKSLTELASSRDIVDFVSRDTSSIGYSGTGLLTSGVKAVNIGKSKNNCYPPEFKYAMSKQYPLTRDLYLYLKENPAKGMKKITKEFLKYLLSKDGQEAVIESGLITLPASTIKEERKKITN
jgi:phosphate transport system substrate-binding protein